MAISNSVYSMSEWQLAILGETTTGTKIATSMQKVNIDGDVSVSSEIVQTLDVRSGTGRTLKTGDVFTTDYGGLKSTITFDCVHDEAVSALLHASALADAGSSSVWTIADTYAPGGRGIGDTSGTAANSMTVALVSPIASKTRFFTGCVVTNLTVKHDASVEGGRGHCSVTIETAMRPADGTTDPTYAAAAFSSDFTYLRDFAAKKSIGGSEVVLNKLEYTIENPAVFPGGDASGDPEIISRAQPGINFSVLAGVKYDVNTEDLWQSRRAGTITAVEISNHATWASATIGLKSDYMKIVDTPMSGTDAGVFQDLSLVSTVGDSQSLVILKPFNPA